MRFYLLVIALLASVSLSAQANRLSHSNGSVGNNADVVVDMPPEVWTQGQNTQPDCLRCCLFENRNYTEGAVVKSEGVLLQCARDEKSLGTNNLIWKIVK